MTLRVARKEADFSWGLTWVNEVAIDTGAIVGGLVFGGGDGFAQNTVERTFECN